MPFAIISILYPIFAAAITGQRSNDPKSDLTIFNKMINDHFKLLFIKTIQEFQ